jgi:hypothetical protein
MQTISVLEQAKQQKIDNQRKEREFLQLKECSFTPQSRTLKTSKSTAEVRGIERFMELRSMAQRKKDNQQLREQQVFKLKLAEQSKTTVPKPFNLHLSKKQDKLSETQRQLEDKFNRECTFQPMRSYYH